MHELPLIVKMGMSGTPFIFFVDDLFLPGASGEHERVHTIHMRTKRASLCIVRAKRHAHTHTPTHMNIQSHTRTLENFT